MTLQNPVNHAATPVFWRDTQLPFIEARSIADGRKVCYSRHSHDVFSIGAILSGQSTYLHEKTDQLISAGTVVLMNPGDVHACNPIDDQPWSYIMLYVDAQWLGRVQQACGIEGFHPIPTISSTDPALFSDGAWHFPDAERTTLHYQSGGRFFATGEAFVVPGTAA